MVECFNYHLVKLAENGIFNQLMLKAQERSMNYNTIDDGITLTYENVLFPSLIMAFGIIISVCQWAVENVWFRVRGKKMGSLKRGTGMTSHELSRLADGAVKQGQEELGHDEDMSAIEI